MTFSLSQAEAVEVMGLRPNVAPTGSTRMFWRAMSPS